MKKLFGTDGVRGIANLGLTPETALALGRASATVLGVSQSDTTKRATFIIGRDTRVSGEMLQSALIAGVLSTGVDVIDVGVVSTPAIAWLTQMQGLQAGVVISASHNPMQDNGIKFFGHDGYKLPDATELSIESAMEKPLCDHVRPIGAAVGRLYYKPDLVHLYQLHLLEGKFSLEGYRIVIDCANGAASALAAWPFEQAGACVTLIAHEPDGYNINVDCGSTHLDNLRRMMQTGDYDLGLALDGDADRCLAVSATGVPVDGDHMLAILAVDMKNKGTLSRNTVVCTVMSNMGFHQAMAHHEIQSPPAQVGDRYVLEAMRNGGYTLGGEQSGHIIVGSNATTGDGLLTGLHLAQCLVSQKKSLDEAAAVMQRFPQRLENCIVRDKDEALSDTDFIAAQKKVEEQLAHRGRLLVRPSGTEALVRITVEAPTQEEVDASCQYLASFLQKYRP